MDERAMRAGPEPELTIAFADDEGSVVVNFGILTGREATQAEVDRLAESLRGAGSDAAVTISAVRRQDYGAGIETVSHQVHVLARGRPAAEVEEICRRWATACAEDRRVSPL